MKKLILLTMVLFAFSATSNAQAIRFGLKGGANFATLDGSGIDSDNITSWHAGALVELNLFQNFSLQPELMYSSQGAKVDGAGDFKLDYVSIPVLAKFYLISDVLSLEAGPQFSFLVNDSYDNILGDLENESFDFAAVAGLGFNLTDSFFAQARYVIGLTEANKDAEVTNKVIQLSVGYRF
jgi:opacity protein-like surface antigen